MTTRTLTRNTLTLCGALALAAALACSHANSSRASRSGCAGIAVDASDVARLLETPAATARSIPGDAESCEFVSGARQVQVSVRPSVGRLTVGSWIGGRMPLHVSTLAGVGEAAVWQPDLRELFAEQEDVLCDVSMSAAGNDTGQRASQELARKMAALCKKVFARAAPLRGEEVHLPWSDR